MQAIGIDLGGTRIKGVLIDQSGKILQELILDTKEENQQWKNDVKKMHLHLNAKSSEHTVVGISAPGIPNKTNTCIEFMPDRLNGIENFIWKDHLETDAWVMNDAIAALSAEAHFGKAKDAENVILITIGTGVGGAIIIDKKIYQGAFQKAGHIGHMSIDMEGVEDICGMPGSLEEAIGNYSISKRSNGKYNDTLELLNDVQQNNPEAIAIWNKSIKALAVGIASLSNILSPEKIILAGGITRAGKILMEPLLNYMDKYEWRAGGNRLTIEMAHFSDKSGAIGAAAFALSKTTSVHE